MRESNSALCLRENLSSRRRTPQSSMNELRSKVDSRSRGVSLRETSRSQGMRSTRNTRVLASSIDYPLPFPSLSLPAPLCRALPSPSRIAQKMQEEMDLLFGIESRFQTSVGASVQSLVTIAFTCKCILFVLFTARKGACLFLSSCLCERNAGDLCLKNTS